MKNKGYRWLPMIVLIAGCFISLRSSGQDLPGNLLVNAGFEVGSASAAHLPDVWMTFASKSVNMNLVSSGARSGTRCIALQTQGALDAYQGLTQGVPVEPGFAYQFSAYARVASDVEVKGTPFGQLAIEWHNEAGKEVARTWGPTWQVTTSKLRWEMISMSAEAPENATTARFTILLNDGKPSGSFKLLVDDVSAIALHK